MRTGALIDTAQHKERYPRFRGNLAGGPAILATSQLGLPLHLIGRDQGQTPTCVGFGVSLVTARALGLIWDPSGKMLCLIAKMREGQDLTNCLEGTYSTGAWDVVRTLGLPRGPEPTDQAWDTLAGIVSKDLVGLSRRIAPHRIDGGSEALRLWVGGLRRMSTIVLPVDQSFKNLKPGQVWDGPRGDGEPHCVAVAGHDDNLKAFRIENSWGFDWCDGGSGLVSYSAVDKYGQDIIGPEVS